MDIKCPACRKINDSGNINCIRCECDISPLIAILNQAEQEIEHCRYSLNKGDGEKALRHAASSWQLKNSKESAQLAFLAALKENNEKEASLWYARALL